MYIKKKLDERLSIEQVEESTSFAPKFDQNGLIPVVTTDFKSGEVLMQGQLLSMGLVLVSIGAALFIFATLIKAIEGRK